MRRSLFGAAAAGLVVAALLVMPVTLGGRGTGAIAEEPSEPPVPGMIGYWTFDEGSGSTATDGAGDYDGTIHGATWTTGKVGKALSFDGLDDEVEIPAGLAEANRSRIDFTIEAWIRPESCSSVMYSIMEIGTDKDFPPWGWGALLYLTTTRHVTLGTAYQGGVDSQNQLEMGQWHHVVGLRNGTVMQVWVDGVPTSGTGSDTTLRSLGKSFIGNHYWWQRQTHFQGILDEVAVYDRALTAAEILLHYGNGLNGLGYGDAPVAPAEALEAVLEEMDLPAAAATSLFAKLDEVQAATDSKNSEQRHDAANKLAAFINAVEAKRGKSLTSAQANLLVAFAEEGIRRLR